MPFDSAKRVISGTWGELWLDGEYVSECYGLQAKIAFNKEAVKRAGIMGEDAKTVSYKGTGSMKLHKVTSRMAAAIGAEIRNGRDLRFTIVSKLADPDAYGAERVAIKNVSLDDLTIADWEVGVVGKTEAPFTFTDYEYLDMINA